MTMVNNGKITGTWSWYKILPLSGFSLIRTEQGLHRRSEKVYGNFSSCQNGHKSFTLRIRWNLANLVKIFHGITERQHLVDPRRMAAVRRVKEGTSAVLLQSGLDEKRWADSMECHCYLRNIQDLLSDGKTSYERRFGVPFKGPIIPFGATVEHYPISARHQSCGGIWKGDNLVADIEELEKMDASEIHPGRINGKEVLMLQRGGHFTFPKADGTAKLSGRDYEFRVPTLRREPTVRSENLSGWNSR